MSPFPEIKETTALRLAKLARAYARTYGDDDMDRVMNRLMDKAQCREDIPVKK